MIKPKGAGMGLMVSEFVCPCNGNIVDPDTGKPCCVILMCDKNYDGYWTGEDVTTQLQDTDTTFVTVQSGCLPLYLFNISENHHKIAIYDLNVSKLNLKYGGKNTPLPCNG